MGLKINPDSVRLMIGNVEIRPCAGMENVMLGKPLPSVMKLRIEIGDADLRKFLNGRMVTIEAIEPDSSGG